MNETNKINQEPFDINDRILEKQGTMVQTRTEYHCAVSVPKPRQLEKIQEDVLKEAAIAKDDFYYSWKVKDRRNNTEKWIEGGTIGLAQCCFRSWTNCVLDTKIREEKGEWIFNSTFIDVEKGVVMPREFRFKIPLEANGKYDYERTKNMAFQMAQSKNQRDAILNALPRWLKNKAIEVAKEASRKEVEESKDLSEKRDKAVKFFAQENITEKELCDYFNKNTINDFGIEDIVRLRNLANQLMNKEITSKDIKLAASDIFDKKPDILDKIKDKKNKVDSSKTEPTTDEKEEDYDPVFYLSSLDTITDSEICAYSNVEDLGDLSPEHLDSLKVIAESMKSGKMTDKEFKKIAFERFEMRQKSNKNNLL